MDPSTGGIIGLANLDNTVVVFKRRAIYLISGEGPDATGVGAFNPPYRLSVDTGLYDVGSIISTEKGVFYRSIRGIEMLDRGGASVQYVGKAIEQTFAAPNANVQNATVVPSQSQVRFAVMGFTYSYDWNAQAWVRSNYVNSYSGLSRISHAIYQNVLYMGLTRASNASTVVREQLSTSTDGSDNGTNATQILRSAWIPVADMHGWGRVRRINILGQCGIVNTVVAVQCAYDYDNFATTAVVNATIASSGHFHIRVRTTRQVCQAISIMLTVTAPGAVGTRFTVSQIDLETSVKSGTLRRPDTVSY